MRALDIFATFLILGICSPAITRALSRSTDELIRKIQELESIPDLTFSYEGRLKIVEVDRMIREKCEQNGGPGAYDSLGKRLQDLLGSMQSRLHMEQLEAEIANASSNAKWKIFFNKYCPEHSTFKESGKRLSDSIKSCLEPEERNVVDITHSVMSLLMEFICRDGGDKYASFLEVGGAECLRSQKARLQTCGTAAILGYDVSGNPLGAAISDLASLSSLDLGQKECKNIDGLRNCIVAALKDCENPDSAIVMDSMLISFKKLTSCQNIIVSSTQAYEVDTWITTTTPKEDVSSGAEKNFVENFIRNKCEKNGGPKAFDTAFENLQFVSNCSKLVFDGPQLGPEIFTAQTNGDVDALIQKYCRRAPILNELDKYYVGSIKPCLELEERRSVDVIHNVSSATLDFICRDEGAPITTFIASGGLACVSSRQEAMLRCARENFYSYVEAIGSIMNGSSETLPVLGSKFCTDLDNFKDCSVKVLAGCEDQTSVNLINSMLTSISDKIPCDNLSEIQPLAVLEIANATYAPEVIESPDVLPATESDLAIITGLVEPESMNMTKKEAEKYLREKCERNGGPMAYDTAKEMPEYLSGWYEAAKEDMSQVVSDTAISRRNRPYGKLNIAFIKYCRKAPSIEMRMRYVAESIKLCLDPEDREQVDIIRNIASSMLEFGCQNKANNIAKFLATGGAECLTHSDGAVQNCVKQISPGHVLPSKIHILQHPSIAECTVLREFQSCVVNAMKECKDPTPATIMDSLLNHVVEQIPCK